MTFENIEVEYEKDSEDTDLEGVNSDEVEDLDDFIDGEFCLYARSTVLNNNKFISEDGSSGDFDSASSGSVNCCYASTLMHIELTVMISAGTSDSEEEDSEEEIEEMAEGGEENKVQEEEENVQEQDKEEEVCDQDGVPVSEGMNLLSMSY
jgi:hypothetical protein